MIPRNDSTSTMSFRGWLHYMTHIIATQLEHYRSTNNSGETLPAGSIVYASGNSEMDLAVADIATPEKSSWIGVLETTTPDGDRGTIKNAGYVKVLFKDNESLNAAAGAFVLVSDEAGKGTVDPMQEPDIIVGHLADASEYDGDNTSPTYNPYAYVYIRTSCASR